MKKQKGFTISGGAVLLLGVLWFFSDTVSFFALLLAVAFHEAGHLAALRVLGGRVTGVRFDASGAMITRRGAMSSAQEIVCAAAGPLSGILFAVAASLSGNALKSAFLLQCAGISLALSVFNMLPVLPLDGGRILSAAWRNRRACVALSFVSALSVLCIGLVLMTKRMGAGLLIAGIWLMLEQAGL